MAESTSFRARFFVCHIVVTEWGHDEKMKKNGFESHFFRFLFAQLKKK